MSNSEHSRPHILPLRLYMTIGAILLFLTVVTVVVATFDFGALNLIVAMLIAVIKATLVALFFMHLIYDSKVYATIFVLSLIFLGIFIILTMFDTMRRGDLYTEVEGQINKHAVIYEKEVAGSASVIASDSTVSEVSSDDAKENSELE